MSTDYTKIKRIFLQGLEHMLIDDLILLTLQKKTWSNMVLIVMDNLSTAFALRLIIMLLSEKWVCHRH